MSFLPAARPQKGVGSIIQRARSSTSVLYFPSRQKDPHLVLVFLIEVSGPMFVPSATADEHRKSPPLLRKLEFRYLLTGLLPCSICQTKGNAYAQTQLTRVGQPERLVVIEPSRYVFETLREDEEFVLERGQGDGGLSAILVVASLSEHPVQGILERLEHEYALRDELNSDWAARPLTLAHRKGRTMLILEDPGGEPLDRLLGQPMELTRFLRFAVGLSAALGKLHQQGLIHKDVKPANILANSATGAVWLTGFGIASRLPRERQSPEPPEVIAGTLAYMAPEQTGRMNRSIDSRSDLYSLGVTFYQMLTGSLPFTAADPMEWVHCHVARNPVPPCERLRNVPAPVSAIIMKLLAKTVEERYQTASGLEADLRRYLAQWETQGRIDDFPLGEHDAPDRLVIPEKLYGREREIETLLASFDRIVKSGALELVLVSGYSGIGKSSVVNELHKALVPPRGLFAAGKFDQYKRDIPYSTLAQAFQSLVRSLLGKSDTELSGWREALLKALGPNGRLMVDIVPELKLIIGEQPPVPELPPQDAQRRFQLVFRRFIGVFARPEHPLALFLDDLQWLDAATLDLLEDLLTQSDLQHLMLIGAYRDNEVTAAHPLMRKLGAIKTAGGKVAEITLAPLAREHLGQLIADALRCESERTAPLAQLVHEKTGGNPFFAIQFMSSFAEERMLTFDHDAARWSWDLDGIHAKGYTDNVVDLMVGKLARLPAETQKALQQLACLGNTAEITRLSIVRETSEEQVHATLWPAARQELVERMASTYRFVHDRVQEAAYSLIPVDQRAALHLRIGRRLVAAMSNEELTEQIFDVVNQFNHAMALISDPDELARAADLNLRAGRKPRASTAYASASRYLSAGMALLGPSGWATCYDLAFGLTLERAECTFLSTQFDETEGLIMELLRRAVSNTDKAAVYRLKIELHVVKSEHPQAVDSALECLRLFGIDMPTHPSRDDVDGEYEKVWRNLGDRPIESLIDRPIATAPEAQAAMRVLTALITPAYNTDINLFDLQICQMVNLSLKHGITNGSVHGFGWFGGLLCYAFHRYGDGYRFGKLALDLVEKRGFAVDAVRVNYQMGFITSWMKPLATSIEFFRSAFHRGVEASDHLFSISSASQVIIRLILTGVALDEVWRESENFLEFARRVGFRDGVDRLVSQQRFVAAMRGRTGGLSTYSDAEFDEPAFEAELTADRMTMMVCWYWILKIGARFLSGDYGQAFEAAEKAKRLIWASTGQIQLLDYHFYTALTLVSLAATIPPEQRGEWRAHIIEHREQLRHWAQTCPENFGSAASLVEAEIARIDDRDLEAMRIYEQAIREAREQGFIQIEGIANEIAARFYAARGFEDIAHLYLRKARYCYVRWGADGKVRQLDEIYPHFKTQEAALRPTSTIEAPVEQLDLATVIKVSHAVAGEIVLEKLIKTLMMIAVEHAVAERGLLILSHGEELRIAAEARTGRDGVDVQLQDGLVTPSDLPNSLLHYVIRTQESVILDDASVQSLFLEDEYVRQRCPKSVLSLPLVKQAKLMGVLYLENSLVPRVFTPKRLAMLEMLASQAAISLDHARLYAELTQENSDRRKAEEALRATEERWRKLFENSSAGIALVTPDGRYVAANLAFQNMFGYTEAELQRLTVPEVTHEEDRAAAEAILAEFAEGRRRVYRVEKRYLRKDGGVIWADVTGVFVPATGSVPAFFESVVVDITERKRAEEALRASEQRLQDIVDNTTAVIFVKDLDLRYLLVNREYERRHRVQRDQIRGKTDFDILPHDVAEAVRDNDRQVIEAGVPIQFEETVPSDGGEHLYVSAKFLLRDHTGKPYAVCGIATDITALKRAEEMRAALTREREMLAQQRAAEMTKANEALRSGLDTLASVPELDETGNFWLADESWAHLFGFDNITLSAWTEDRANIVEQIKAYYWRWLEKLADEPAHRASGVIPFLRFLRCQAAHNIVGEALIRLEDYFTQASEQFWEDQYGRQALTRFVGFIWSNCYEPIRSSIDMLRVFRFLVAKLAAYQEPLALEIIASIGEDSRSPGTGGGTS